MSDNQPQRRWTSDVPTEELPTIHQDKRRNLLAWILVIATALLLVLGTLAIVYVLFWWR